MKLLLLACLLFFVGIPAIFVLFVFGMAAFGVVFGLGMAIVGMMLGVLKIALMVIVPIAIVLWLFRRVTATERSY